MINISADCIFDGKKGVSRTRNDASMETIILGILDA
jgi:dTDP-4-dehydrorhamnose reductase